jgi:hypothetical protein
MNKGLKIVASDGNANQAFGIGGELQALQQSGTGQAGVLSRNWSRQTASQRRIVCDILFTQILGLLRLSGFLRNKSAG